MARVNSTDSTPLKGNLILPQGHLGLERDPAGREDGSTSNSYHDHRHNLVSADYPSTH